MYVRVATFERPESSTSCGDRNYGAHEPEGHAWSFATHVHDPSPEEMRAAMEGATAS